MIDEKEDWSPRGSDTIERLIIERSISYDGVADAEVQSEVLAELCAIEILYPYEFRADDFTKIKSEEYTLTRLSVHYEIPEFVIGRALQKWYRKIADEVWENINKGG